MPRRAASATSTRAAVDRSLKVGDHAYLAPPCSERECAPYCIVRIIDMPTPGLGEVPKVKVAYYLRRRDVTNRSLADHRVIFATFTDGIVPLSHIRQKVQVMFRDYLDDPETFKRQPDCFVFTQIYDRFMHKPFDLVPTSQVLNAPDKVVAHLKSHYEFVCTETSTANQLSDAMRGCVACHEFAAKDDSVTCTMCSRTWHLRCTEPPLLKKPALGWKWSCIKCTMQQAEEDSDSDSIGLDRFATRVARNNIKPLNLQKNGKLDKGKGPALDVQLDVAKWKMTDGWPYRYFGLHLHFDSILDPHDPIWPRASTNVGSRYQVSDIPGDEPESSAFKRRGPVPKRRGGRKAVAEEEEPEIERGGEDTVTNIWTLQGQKWDDKYENWIAQARDREIEDRRGNVDYIVDTLLWLQSCNQQSVVPSAVLNPPTEHASTTHWGSSDASLLDRDLEEHGDDLINFSLILKRRSMAEVVHRFYRNHGFSERFMHSDDPERDIFAAAGPQGSGATQREVVGNDDGETSVIEDYSAPESGKRWRRVCAICSTDNATVWYRCPEGLGEVPPAEACKERAMCPSCSIQWRHYGNEKPAPTELELEIRASKDGRLKARLGTGTPRLGSPGLIKAHSAKTTSREAKSAQPGRVVLGPMKSCVLCKRPEPKALNYECTDCGVVVHTQCYGVEEGLDPLEWKCDVCREFAGSTLRQCTLCPVTSVADSESSRTALDALKPIEGSDKKMMHLICAIWHPEVLFKNEQTLAMVHDEIIASQLSLRYEKVCTICKSGGQDVGCVVKCDCCNDCFHVGCAWRAGYRFAFEIKTLTPTAAERIRLPTASFKGEEGDMIAVIICKGHPWDYARRLYELGQKDKTSNLVSRSESLASIIDRRGLMRVKTDQTTLMAYTKYMKWYNIFEQYPCLMPMRMAYLQLDAPAEWMPWSSLPQGVPTKENWLDVYERKTVDIRTFTKPGRKKKAQEEAGSTPPVSFADSLGNSVQDSDDPSLPSTSGIRKRRRTSPPPEQEYYDYSSLSEDEVMPSATTSRARNAARPTRGVTLQDLLVEEVSETKSASTTRTTANRSLALHAPSTDDTTKVPTAAAATSAPLHTKIAPRPPAIDTKLASSTSRARTTSTTALPAVYLSENRHRQPATSSQDTMRHTVPVYSETVERPDHLQRSGPPAWQTLTLPNLTHAYYAPLYRHQQLQQIASLRQSFFASMAGDYSTSAHSHEDGVTGKDQEAMTPSRQAQKI